LEITLKNAQRAASILLELESSSKSIPNLEGIDGVSVEGHSMTFISCYQALDPEKKDVINDFDVVDEIVGYLVAKGFGEIDTTVGSCFASLTDETRESCVTVLVTRMRDTPHRNFRACIQFSDAY